MAEPEKTVNVSIKLEKSFHKRAKMAALALDMSLKDLFCRAVEDAEREIAAKTKEAQAD